MIRHFFLTAEPTSAAARWLAAFPAGECGAREEVLERARPGDMIWVPTHRAGWDIALESLGRALPRCLFVALSLSPGGDEGLLALERGARGYCHALSVPGMLREVAQVVSLGGLWVGPELMTRMIAAAGRALPPPRAEPLEGLLSAREAQVAEAVASGLSNKEVAAKLGITERTVKAHLGAAFEKLGVRDRLQLVVRLSRHARTVTTE